MLWTAPPPARECQEVGAVLRLPRFGGAAYAVNFHDRSGYCEVGLPSADAVSLVVVRRHLRRRQVLAFFSEVAAMPGRPNTWLLRPMLQSEDSSCQPGAVHTWALSKPSGFQTS